MMRISLLAVILGLCSPAMSLADDATAEGERTKSLKSSLQGYVQAFNDQDLEKVTGFWAEACSYHDQTTGERRAGRDAMRADLKQVFKDHPKLQLAATVEHTKWITNRVAQVEGQTVVSSPEDEPLSALFTAVLVQGESGWQIHSLVESALPSPETARDALAQLEWMIGTWEERTEDIQVTNSVKWSANGAFLLRSFKLQTADNTERTGTQIIGWDPRSQSIRSWTFNSDGSFGEGTWSKSGEEWRVKSTQTLADGRLGSGTFLISVPEENRMEVSLIGHTIDGAPQPSMSSVTMKRLIEEPAETDTETSKSFVDPSGPAK